ncbi:MAG: T9SS C-terminal target domain-containing protein, partial [Flavobacteriales bacterium]
MALRTLFTLMAAFFIVPSILAQNIEWEKSLGASSLDEAHSIQQTNDGGYVLAGRSGANDGDVWGNHGNADFWVVKLNSSGDTSWTRSLGGSDYDVAHSVRQTSDGGYVLAGRSGSDDGDVSGNYGFDDFWVVKLNSSGDTSWTRSMGGSSPDNAYSVQQTSDGGYIVAGRSGSYDGYVSGSHGGFDFWVVKLNGSGDTSWTRSLGGYY